jgi:hypothetical protein
MEKCASSWLYASDGRLCRLGQWLDDCDPHCAQCREESVANFLLVPVIDGDRRSIAGIVAANFDLFGKALPLAGSSFG